MLGNVSDLHSLHGFFSGQWLLMPLCQRPHGNTAVLNTEVDLQTGNERNRLYFRLWEALRNFTVKFTLKNFFFRSELPLHLSNQCNITWNKCMIRINVSWSSIRGLNSATDVLHCIFRKKCKYAGSGPRLCLVLPISLEQCLYIDWIAPDHAMI